MMRTWILVAALLAALCAPAVARAEDEPKTTDEKLAVISRKLDTVLGRLNEVSQLRDQVADLRKELSNLQKDHSLKVQADQANLDTLNAKIDALEKKVQRQFESIDRELATLRTPPANSSDVRRSPPTPEVLAGTGRIRLLNTFTRPVVVSFNGKSYTLQPNDQTVLADQPVGPLTYEVFDDQGNSIGRRNSSVTRNETLVIRIHPQP